MSNSSTEILTTPRQDDLGLVQITNSAGISISLLPSGAIFCHRACRPEAADHDQPGARLADRQRHGTALPSCRRTRAGDSAVDRPGGGASGRRRERPLCLGGRRERRQPSRHPLVASERLRLAVAARRRQPARRGPRLRRRPRPGSRARRSGLPDEQRGLRQPVSRPPYCPASAPRPRNDEPAESIAGRHISLGRAWLPRRRCRLRDRFSPVHGPEPSGRRPVRHRVWDEPAFDAPAV